MVDERPNLKRRIFEAIKEIKKNVEIASARESMHAG
jgi:hypothetical protein